MKCPNCDGSGWDDEHMIKCLRCHGSGEVEMTNDEWRRTCSAEEFANWIREDVCADSFWQRAYDWEKWLKEKHGESE